MLTAYCAWPVGGGRVVEPRMKAVPQPLYYVPGELSVGVIAQARTPCTQMQQ